MPTDTDVVAEQETRALAERVVIDLARAMKNISFYDVGHPVVHDVVGEVSAGLESLLEARPELTLKVVSGYLVAHGTPLLGHHASIGNLIGACHRRGVEAMVFQQGVTVEEVERLVAMLAADPKEVDGMGGPARALAAQGVRRIAIERLRSAPAAGWLGVHVGALDVLRGAARAVRLGHALDVGSIQLSVHEIVDDILGDRAIVYNLHSMKGMDEYTFIHALHLCILAVELGRQLGFSRGRLEELGTATLLHDVGKILVPLEVLRKPGALDAAEFAVMSRHPADGAAALLQETSLPEVAPLVAFEHHIHCDHSGYPKLRRPRELHMYSLMASVVDIYDALTTLRPYRPAMPPHRAIEIIRQQYAGRLEPRLLARFLEMLGPHPWGTLLALPNGHYAVVTRPNAAAPERPFARALELRAGQAVVSTEEVPLNRLADVSQVHPVDPVELGLDLVALFHRNLPQVAPGSREGE